MNSKILGFAVLLIILIGGGYYAKDYQTNRESDKQDEAPELSPVSTSEQNSAQATESYGTSTVQDFSSHVQGDSKGLDYDIKIEGDIAVQTTCGSQDCFDKKFTACQSAKMKSTLTEGLIYESSIVGPKSGYCQVISKFIANPNPEWVGKTMTCLYDNKLPFQTATQDYSRCSGPLAELMFNPKTDTAESAFPESVDPFDPMPPMKPGMNMQLILSRGQTTISGLEFKVDTITSSVVNMTVTDHPKAQSESVTLALNQQKRIVGHDMIIVSIKYVRTGEMNGQATGEYYALVEYN